MTTDLRQIIERGLGPGTFGTHEFNPWQDYMESKSGLLIPCHIITPKKSKSYPTGVDLFSGAGGFTCGLMQAGIHVLAAVDNDPTCMLTYLVNCGAANVQIIFISSDDKLAWRALINKEISRVEKELRNPKMRKWVKKEMDLELESLRTNHWGYAWREHDRIDIPGVKVAFLGDCRKLSGLDILRELGLGIGELDIVVGGPPCQGFSTSGKRQIMDPRNSLVFEFARFVCEMKPKTLCMENVPGILTMLTPEGVPVVDAFCRILEDGGFGAMEALKHAMLLEGKHFGLVQGATAEKPKGIKKDIKNDKEDQPRLL